MASKPTKSSSGPSLTLTVSQAAERLGVSVGTVRRWADKGHLQSFRTPGGQRRFDAAHIEGFLTSLEQGPGARGRRRDDR